MSTDITSDRLLLSLDKDAQRLVQRYRDAYFKVLETPENKRGPKNGYKAVVAKMNAAACDLATWIEVIVEQAHAEQGHRE